MPINPGQLRDCIDLLKQDNRPIDNDSGKDEEFYQTIIAEDFALMKDIKSNPGARYLTTKNTENGPTHNVWIRYDEDILNRGIVDHLTFDGRMFEVQNVKADDEVQRFLVLQVRELGITDATYDIRPVAP